jgi:isoleucyl-tRNA synthetase
MKTIGESVRLFLRQLWNVHAFLDRYEADGPDRGETDLDRWLRSRLSATVAEVTDRMEAYDATFAGRAIADFVDDLSNWYVRRSRRRFWEGDPSAFATLRDSLLTVAQLLAPFAPFVADEIWENLGGEGDSVHLTDWPQPRERDMELETAMAVARETVRLGLAARGQAKVKVRQPLHEAVVVASGAERAAIERLADVIASELNVKGLRFVAEADELGSYEIKPNYRTLGPRFGKAMPQVAAAVAALDPAHVSVAARNDEPVRINFDGTEHALAPEDLLLSMQPLEGYQLEREGSHAVALDLTLDDDLIREGLVREIVHSIQGVRKEEGLDVSDRIVLGLAGDEELLAAVRAHEEYVAGEVLATSIDYGSANGRVTHIEGRELRVSVTRV